MRSPPAAVPLSLTGTRRGQLAVHRQVLPAPDGLIGLRQVFSGSDLRVVVTHEAAVVALVQVEAGAVTFPLASGEVMAPRRFLLALPPRGVVPIRFHEASVRSDGVADFAPLWSGKAALWTSALTEMPLGRAAVRALLAPEAATLLDADAGIAPAVVRARSLLHDQLALPAPVRVAALRVGLAADTLTRQFAAAYALPPKQYCHRARLFAAVLRLLAGRSILETALSVGFNDVSRFYRQFKRVVRATPGEYAGIRKRQDAPAADRT